MRKPLIELVGARGFEPPTPASRTRCATGLRYAPMYEKPSRSGQRDKGKPMSLSHGLVGDMTLLNIHPLGEPRISRKSLFDPRVSQSDYKR